MYEHKQVVIEHGEWSANIDEHIAELILEMWKADIYTLLSCENNNNGKDNGDVVWIMMPQYEVSDFLNCLLAGRERDEFYFRVMGYPEFGDQWRFSVLADDLSEFYDEKEDVVDFNGPPDIHLSMSVRFPIWDYAEVLSRMKAYNANAGRLAPLLPMPEPQRLQGATDAEVAPVSAMLDVQEVCHVG
ncbi:hypothetical protein PDESU_06273 [Pontiella desulfatans]|uniref:Uncharacterized protein n=1 Tax=Pontiella desulfatans TaxID=2750659 RepID=A0A6C2UE21_PONDE|nr:hypothetical protein [Pontiella desulfatans]VGO17671.1 hypothetical protein PDESU_06273 [Pontiella desulfatans]